jgi:hypothetical protein
MVILKKLKTIFFIKVPIMFWSLLIIIQLIFLSSCIKSPANNRKSILNTSNSTTKPDTKLPVFTEGNNFIQNGGVVYTTSVNFDLSFSDTLQLRGKDVDSYIRSTGTQISTCLVGRFTSVEQVFIVAANPHSVYNFSTQALEYYYSLAPSDEITNKNFCQKTGLINKLYSLYPLSTPKYKSKDLCPTGVCVSSLYSSKALEIYSQSGAAITQIATAQLNYNISNLPALSNSTAKTCTGNSECTSSGFDCCSSGQCVKDLALKTGVTTTSIDYIQALQDILNNPNHIYLYPQYYYICSMPSSTTTSGTTTSTNATTAAIIRLNNLTDLYNCTTKIEGELGICTKRISNATVGSVYSAGIDDRSFSNTYTNQSSSNYSPSAKEDLVSIQEVIYGDITLFNYDQITNEGLLRPDPFIVSTYLTLNGQHNDDNASGTTVSLTAKPTNALSNELVIRYRTDASCTQVNTQLGKCEKYYIQGQQKSGDTIILNRRGRVTDHYPASNIFLIPYYASSNKTIKVEVDGIQAKQDLDWKLNDISPLNIEFISADGGLKVFDGQKVKITFYVDLTINHVMDSKLSALTQIQTICHCADLNCSLTPVKNTSGTLTDYACLYPDPTPIVPPISQTIYLSSKAVPVRFFDNTGASQATLTGSTLPQEGNAFSYRKDNLLNPNNMPDITNPVAGESNYIGFNEIYGSLSYTSNAAKPAKEVPVTIGKTYDIYVDGGTYSNCIQCGNDYYSQLNKLFPLTQLAGGLVPLQSRTNRSESNGVRSDDLKFGRACLVPATMLPFSHAISSDSTEQRQSRMRAQHFLYSNGYQYDWYGFDYGSVIGSFDGVRWFSIGSNRRIKADSNKLFIAVNGVFGDLALESTFTVTVNDGSLNPVGSNMVTSDFESDGAQCQKFHQCSTDNDCATTLGWDYICSNANEITTSWPRFDQNAKEIPDAQRDDNRLASILGMSSPGKRCVYRGRGAACTQNYLSSAINVNSTFNQTQTQAFHTCSSNNYCQPITTNGSLNSKFNNRISRYGKVRTDSASDIFGLGAKIPGRPMEFNAEEAIRSETARNFNSNKVASICVPGRSPESKKFVDQNTVIPSPEYFGDKVLGIGMSYKKSTLSVQPKYLASCSVMDSTNNYFYAKADLSLIDAENTDVIYNSGSQSISTNALSIFSSIFNSKGIPFTLYSSPNAVLSTQTFSENRCLRAPGASCFSDLDCAPSKVIADKMKMLTSTDIDVLKIINVYELKFWQEDLICSQAIGKDKSTYSAYDNHCCREVGKLITIPTGTISNKLEMSLVPGIDTPMSNINRYSRVSTVYKDQKNGVLPVLKSAASDQCSDYTTNANCVDIDTSSLGTQYKTFATYAEKTSCSGDWVRNFAPSGTHKWDSTRPVQKYAPTMFRCLNWRPTDYYYTCATLEADDPNCALVQTIANSSKALGVMNFLGKLELMGIPQIAVESEDFFNKSFEGDLSCLSNPDDITDQTYPGGTTGGGNYRPVPNIFNFGSPKREFFDSSTSTQLYSTAYVNNFQTTLKTIFKADEVSSCLPAGTTMAVGADANLCCTGVINSLTNKCQLPDYVDISLYTNRYVSSEARKLNNSLFDKNGYIKDADTAALLACEKQMCASGVVAFGVLVSNLKVPGQSTQPQKPSRFLQGASEDNLSGVLDQYNNGLKLNNHAYCFPAKSSGNSGGDIRIFTCGN